MTSRFFRSVGWPLLALTLPLLIAGLITMKSFGGGIDYFFWRQLAWIGAGIMVFVFVSGLDWKIFNSGLIIFIYLGGVLSLLLLLLLSETSWFHFPVFAIQPSEPMKIFTAMILAKYFSRYICDNPGAFDLFSARSRLSHYFWSFVVRNYFSFRRIKATLGAAFVFGLSDIFGGKIFNVRKSTKRRIRYS